MAYSHIKPRRDTATNWTTTNPILEEGEMGIEVPDKGVGTGVVKMKFGDGVKAWNDLPYADPIDYILGILTGYVKKTDTTVNAGDKVGMTSNNEGGNIWFISPDGAKWEIDANNGNLRIFRYPTDTESQITYWLQKDGKLVVPDVIYAKGHTVITRGDTELNLLNKIGLNYNNEGGNIWWYAPDGSLWEIDACDSTQARIFRYNPDGTHTFFHFNAVDKSIGINGVTVAKYWKTVWVNASPTNGISSETTVNIDFSKYSEFEIIYGDVEFDGTARSMGNIQRTGRIPISDMGMLLVSTTGLNSNPGETIVYRKYEVTSGSSGSIVFDRGYEGTTAGMTYYCIPLKIICY